MIDIRKSPKWYITADITWTKHTGHLSVLMKGLTLKGLCLSITALMEPSYLIGASTFWRISWPELPSMSPWWPLPGLQYWCPIFKSSHCNSFEDGITMIVAPVMTHFALPFTRTDPRPALSPAEGPNSFHQKGEVESLILLHKISWTTCCFVMHTLLKQYHCYQSTTIWFSDIKLNTAQ